MRSVISLLILASLTTGAMAQMGFKSNDKQPAPPPVNNAEEKKAAESAYQRALKVIPNVTEKPDPWKGAR